MSEWTRSGFLISWTCGDIKVNNRLVKLWEMLIFLEWKKATHHCLGCLKCKWLEMDRVQMWVYDFFLKWWKSFGYLQKFLFRDMLILWWYAWVAWSLWRKPWSVLDFVTEFWVIFYSVAIMTSFGYCCRVAQYWTIFLWIKK